MTRINGKGVVEAAEEKGESFPNKGQKNILSKAFPCKSRKETTMLARGRNAKGLR
jgi:hypothetical protein